MYSTHVFPEIDLEVRTNYCTKCKPQVLPLVFEPEILTVFNAAVVLELLSYVLYQVLQYFLIQLVSRSFPRADDCAHRR